MIEWLAGWYNWPFLLALLCGLGYAAVELLFGGLGLDADGDADVAAPDLDIDVDVDIDADTDMDFDADAAAAGAGSWIMSGLAWLGMGKVPLSLLVMTLMITFGSIGLLVNALAADILGATWIAFPVALGSALIVSPGVTHIVGAWIAKIIPADSSTAAKGGVFVGETGTTATSVTSRTGQICIPELGGRPQVIINACVAEGNDTLPRDTEVLVTRYVSEQNTYIVTPTNLEL